MDFQKFTAHIGYMAEAKDEDMPRACFQFWLAYPVFVSLYALTVVSLFVYAVIK